MQLLLDQQTEIQQYKYNGNYNYPILDFGLPNVTEVARVRARARPQGDRPSGWLMRHLSAGALL